MFGLNLWARPFLHPAAAASASGMEGLHLRPPTTIGSPHYMMPGLSDKSAMPLAPNSLLLYRPGEPMLHPGMLRLDTGMHLPPHPVPERSSLHPGQSLHSEDDPYPSAFVPAKRARTEGHHHGASSAEKVDDHGRRSRSPDCRASPLLDGRCPSQGGRSGSVGGPSPGISTRSPASIGRITPDERLIHPDHRSPSPIDISHPRCPVCGTNLQLNEIESHFTMEMEKLKELCGLNLEDSRRDPHMENSSSGCEDRPHCRMSPSGSGSVSGSRYETFMKIRGNRQARLNAKYRPRRKRPSDPCDVGMRDEEPGRRSSGEHPGINMHINGVVTTTSKHDDVTNTSVHDTSTSTIIDDDEDKDAEIDVTTPDPMTTSSGAMDLRLGPSPSSNNNVSPPSGTINPDNTRCQVCQGTYNKPVTSIQCWHVHCEECWLKALNTKRLCPQCNMMTSPADLRKVFI